MADLNKRIIYTDDDGNCCVMVPSPNTPLTIEELQVKDVPSGKTSYIVDRSELPTDFAFRDAWTYTPD